MDSSQRSRETLLTGFPSESVGLSNLTHRVISIRKDGVTRSAELRYHGEYGVEAQILRDGELRIRRRFPLRACNKPVW